LVKSRRDANAHTAHVCHRSSLKNLVREIEGLSHLVREFGN
jgi:hypothetical protein